MKYFMAVLLCLGGYIVYNGAACVSPAIMQKPFIQKLMQTAGANAQECGLVSLAENKDNALACAKRMLKDKKPFFVGIQRQGIDSTLWAGLALNISGELKYIWFDSDVSGSVCLNPRITITNCTSVVFSDENGGGFKCVHE